MKRILITGKNSYIGNSFEKWVTNDDNFYVEKISLKDGNWEKIDFSTFDVVIHVAGIVHVKETRDKQPLYYKINRDLAFRIAQKSKKEGVLQFVFLSTMNIYGINSGKIDKGTKPEPKTRYGKSKLEAEQLINGLQDNKFFVAILRPPMVYGKNCKGNYAKLSKLAQRTFLFPNIVNRRSMIYVDNLTEFIKQLVINMDSGIFFPQNSEYVCTSELVFYIAKCHNKKIHFTKIFNYLLRASEFKSLNKIFGNLVYEMEMSEYKNNYRVCDFKESIKLSEGKL